MGSPDRSVRRTIAFANIPMRRSICDLIAVGDQRSDRDVIVLRVPVKKALKCREQRHEQGDAVGSAQET